MSTDRARYNHRDQTTGLLQSKQRDAGGNSPFIDVGHNQTTPEHRQVPSCIDPPRQTSPATELKLFFQIIKFSVTDQPPVLSVADDDLFVAPVASHCQPTQVSIASAILSRARIDRHDVQTSFSSYMCVVNDL
jgi:hypothetical protein